MKTLKLRLRPAAESIIRQGHPWVFADSLKDLNREGEAGEMAIIYDRADRFLAIGFYDPASPIRVRIIHSGQPEQITTDWWKSRVAAAFNRRTSVIPAETTGYRCINGESDGFPALVLDRYGDVYVLKIYSEIWLPWLKLINEMLPPELDQVVLRLSRNLEKTAREKYGLNSASVLRGATDIEQALFTEYGLVFEANVLQGQKTGFFLDQRENRKELEQLSDGKNVINCFSFSGGFSLYAARGGAATVTSVDISAHALASAERNFELNRNIPAITRSTHLTVKSDAFDYLRDSTKQFDLVIVDPPSMAKKSEELPAALKAYHSLSRLAAMRTKSQGILLACSCSSHVSFEKFSEAVEAGIKATGKTSIEIKRTTQPLDHPAAFPEAKYLKALFLKIS